MACVEQNPGPSDRYIFRYKYLLIEIGTDVMRKIFDLKVGNDFGQYLSANNTESGKLQELIWAKRITADQIQYLPPIDNSPKSNNFDITLLSCLLRNVCGPTDVSLEADLARLEECRNHLQHKDKVFISETDLKDKWNELSQILTRMNAGSGIRNLSALINTAEKMCIDEDLKKRHDLTIKAWNVMESETKSAKLDIDELKIKGENIEEINKRKRQTMHTDATGIKNHLVKIYDQHCRTLPVSPLCDEEDVELLSIYESPSLYHIPYHRTPGKEETYPISSYKELFCKDDCSFRKIYITGDAGVGKTSFCKRMALLWCKSQSGETVSNRRVQNDIDFMAQFDFVFYVSLGETNRNDVVTMIVEQLFSIENDGKKNEMFESVENIIMKNECFIIMDAFDEWTSKENGTININKLSLEKCTFLTTCRAYKIEIERLSPNVIDRQVLMTGLNLSSSKRYVSEIVNQINTANGDNKSPDDFIRDVKKCKLTAQLRIPIIASHLVAVWFDDNMTKMSRALVYSCIIDMLFKRAEERKHIDFSSLEESKVQFPDPLSDRFYLKKNISLLMKLSLLSFNMLFDQGNCFSDLVFTTEQLESEPYCVSAEEIDFLCKFGILSKPKVICGFGNREETLSFLHKSYLEYFAAMFVFSFDTGNAFEDVVMKWNTITDVVKFDNFFLFFVGFSVQKSKIIFENIYDSISDDLSSCRRNALSHIDGHSNKEQIKSLQAMFINCLKEVSDSNDTILSLDLEDFMFGKEEISDNDDIDFISGYNDYDDNIDDDTENDDYLYNFDNYEDYNDDDNYDDDNFYVEDKYEDYDNDDNANYSYCFDIDDHEYYIIDDNYDDSSFYDDDNYEDYNDDGVDNDVVRHDENDYEDYNDFEDYSHDSIDDDDYYTDDNDYENDDDNNSDGHCPDDNDYENGDDEDNDIDGYFPDNNVFENENNDDNESGDDSPDDNFYEDLSYDEDYLIDYYCSHDCDEIDDYCHDEDSYDDYYEDYYEYQRDIDDNYDHDIDSDYY